LQELLIKEEWRKVEDFPYYHVSSLGRIRSSNPFANKPRILSGSYSCRGGYQTVILTRYQDNKREKKCFTVHPLVARAFIGPRPAGYELHHKDGNPRNNAASNLEYVTSSENTTRAVDMGRWPVGSRRWNAVHSESEAELVLELKATGLRPSEIRRRTNLPMGFVCHVYAGRAWRHVVREVQCQQI
jgi:hypothetical protein